MTLYPSDYKLIKNTEGEKTTLGRLIFNKVFIERLGFEGLFDYQNKVFKAGDYGKFDKAVANALKEDKISTTKMVEYINVRDWFGLEIHGVITTSFSLNTLRVPDNVKKLKKELLDKYKDEIEKGNSRVVEDIENKLLEETLKSFKGDLGLDLYVSGARGSISNHLKNILLSRGAIANPVTGKFDIVTNSLMDGLSKKDITPHSNTIVTGAYPKSVGTQVSGYLAKQLLSSHQGEILGEAGSDCGSTKTIPIVVPKSGSDLDYRYFIEGGKLKQLTPENMSKYAGKTLNFRTVQYCKTLKTTGHICNKCAGDFYYKMGKTNIGLICKSPSSSLTQLSLQKFHQNLVKYHKLDINDLLI